MESNQLLINTIKLDDGYFVREISINDSEKEIIVYIDHENVEHKCPDCNAKSQVYDHINKTWRHVDFIDYRVYLEYRNPRVKCENHGVKLQEVTWAKPRHSFTITMEEFIYELSQKIPLMHVSKLVGEHDTRLKRVITKLEKEKNDQNK